MYVHVKCMEIEFTISYHVYFAISLNWNHSFEVNRYKTSNVLGKKMSMLSKQEDF